MWFFWLRQRWPIALAGLSLLLAAALAVVLALGHAPPGVAFLGDVSAPRSPDTKRSGILLPRSAGVSSQPGSLNDPRTSLLDLPVAADAGPQSVAAAQAAWSAAEREQHQRAVLDSINCARREEHLAALTLDPELSQTAEAAWLRLARERGFSLAQLDDRYALRGVLPLNQQATNSTACANAGFDPAALADLGPATRIGIAVFPPQASWDLASAVILAQ